MRIIFDDLTEFVEVRLRCENTRKKIMCKYCPFYDRCEVNSDEDLHTMCCDILSMQKVSLKEKLFKESKDEEEGK